VRRGETLASIARQNHVGVEELAQLNGLAPHSQLKAGNQLIVEVSDRKVRHRKKKAAHATTDHALAATRKLSAVNDAGTTRPALIEPFRVTDLGGPAVPAGPVGDWHIFVS